MHEVQAFPSPHPPALNPRGRILHPLHPAAPWVLTLPSRRKGSRTGWSRHPDSNNRLPSKQLHPGRYERCVRRLVAVKTPLATASPGRTLELTSSACRIAPGQSAFPAAVSVACQQ